MKIGISKNVSRRLYKLRIEHNDPTLELIAYVPGYREMERKIHFRMMGMCQRVGGEWFLYTTYMRDFIQHYANLMSALPSEPAQAMWAYRTQKWPAL